MKNPTTILMAKHMYTGSILPMDMVRLGRAPYPAHEYHVLVLELPQFFDIAGHGKCMKECGNLEEAEQYICENYPRTCDYPSREEMEKKRKAHNLPPSPPGKLNVGPYESKY